MYHIHLWPLYDHGLWSLYQNYVFLLSWQDHLCSLILAYQIWHVGVSLWYNMCVYSWPVYDPDLWPIYMGGGGNFNELLTVFKKNLFSKESCKQMKETVMMSEEGSIYGSEILWRDCENALICPTLEKGAYCFAPVSLSMDQVMSSHIFWPRAWMFPNLIQWKPLRSTWPRLMVKGKVKVKLLMVFVQYLLTPSLESWQTTVDDPRK